MSILIKRSGVVGTEAGFDFFNTGAKPFNQITGAELVITAGGGSGPLPDGIVFPNFIGNTYAYGWRFFTTQPGSVPHDVCDTVGRCVPQEWGPAALGYSAPYAFADLDLGAAPVGADFGELAISLTRTTTPDLSGTELPIGGWPAPEITEGEQIECDGGSCVLERDAGMARQFWIELVAGRFVLRRQQSITDAAVISGYPGYITHFIDSREGNGSSVRISDPGHCSFVNNVDFTSAYTGTLIITPCCYRGP